MASTFIRLCVVCDKQHTVAWRFPPTAEPLNRLPKFTLVAERCNEPAPRIVKSNPLSLLLGDSLCLLVPSGDQTCAAKTRIKPNLTLRAAARVSVRDTLAIGLPAANQVSVAVLSVDSACRLRAILVYKPLPNLHRQDSIP